MARIAEFDHPAKPLLFHFSHNSKSIQYVGVLSRLYAQGEAYKLLNNTRKIIC